MNARFVSTMTLCCVSHQKGSKNIIALTYGDGTIRTYETNSIDARLHGTKQLITKDEIMVHLQTSEDMILIPVQMAKLLFGWKDHEFSNSD